MYVFKDGENINNSSKCYKLNLTLFLRKYQVNRNWGSEAISVQQELYEKAVEEILIDLSQKMTENYTHLCL